MGPVKGDAAGGIGHAEGAQVGAIGGAQLGNGVRAVCHPDMRAVKGEAVGVGDREAGAVLAGLVPAQQGDLQRVGTRELAGWDVGQAGAVADKAGGGYRAADRLIPREVVRAQHGEGRAVQSVERVGVRGGERLGDGADDVAAGMGMSGSGEGGRLQAVEQVGVQVGDPLARAHLQGRAAGGQRHKPRSRIPGSHKLTVLYRLRDLFPAQQHHQQQHAQPGGTPAPLQHPQHGKTSEEDSDARMGPRLSPHRRQRQATGQELWRGLGGRWLP